MNIVKNFRRDKKSFTRSILCTALVLLGGLGCVNNSEARLNGATIGVINDIAGLLAMPRPGFMNLPPASVANPIFVRIGATLDHILQQALLADPANATINALRAAIPGPAPSPSLLQSYHHMVSVRHFWRNNIAPDLNRKYLAWCRAARVGTPVFPGHHSSFVVPPAVNCLNFLDNLLTLVDAVATPVIPAPVGVVGGAPNAVVPFVPLPLPTYVRVATPALPQVSFAVAQGQPLGAAPHLPVPMIGGAPVVAANTAYIFVDINGALTAGVALPPGIANPHGISVNLNFGALPVPALGGFANNFSEAEATIREFARSYNPHAAIAPAFLPWHGQIGGANATANVPTLVRTIVIKISAAPGAIPTFSIYPV